MKLFKRKKVQDSETKETKRKFHPIDGIKKFFSLIKELKANDKLKPKIYEIIFEADTPAGKLFDVVLIGFIIFSILLIFLESMHFFSPSMKFVLRIFEWVITIFFTLEYALRIYCMDKPKNYILSFYGIVDLLATLPSYLEFLFPGAHFLIIIRAFRLIRVFRVFKLFNFLSEGRMLMLSIKASGRKILVFFIFVLILAISIGTIMYIIEKDQPGSGFNNIPNSIYWTIVTMTTVGYGDITPGTSVGRLLSAIIMLMGYTIIAIPTGIVSVSMMKTYNSRKCPNCGKLIEDKEAQYCMHCGTSLRGAKTFREEYMKGEDAVIPESEANAFNTQDIIIIEDDGINGTTIEHKEESSIDL